MTAHCEDSTNKLAYNNSILPSWNKDWRNVAQEWMLALSLNTGVSNANSSTSRMLAQLVPSVPGWGPIQLLPLTPSIAELLAVMAGSTLLLSSMDSSFYHYWDYPGNELKPGVYERFNASMSSQEYTSGLQQRWQGIFYVVLVLVFTTNVFCLVYFMVRHGLVTDFTEPSNLFALAVNSPPSRRLDGSCGSGPEGYQLDVDWHVMAEDSSGHFYMREGEQKTEVLPKNEFELRRTPLNRNSYSKLSERKSTFL